MIWSVDIHTVATARTPGPEVYFQRDFGHWVDIAIHIFVLRSSLGAVLVDTGLIPDVSDLNAAMKRSKGPEAGFERCGSGVEPLVDDRLAAVLLTSFGPYAAGGANAVPDAVPIYASARGLANLATPEEPCLVHGLPQVVSNRLAKARPVHGTFEVMPGIAMREVGVHHPASTAIEIATEEGLLVIADPIFTADNLTRGVALGAAENAAGWHKLVRDYAARGARFLPIHEPIPYPVAVDLSPDGRWSATTANARSNAT